MRRSKRIRGFSLAELLVAVTLMSVVMTGVYTMFSNTMRSSQLLEEGDSVYLIARTAVTQLQSDVNNLLGPAAYLMEGDKDSLTLFSVAEPMDVEESPGRHLVRARYRFNRGGGELIREEGLVEAQLPRVPQLGEELDRAKIRVSDEETFVVAQNVVDFDLRYIWHPSNFNRRNKDAPPVEQQPVIATRHRERWGIPSGIEATIVIQNPEDPDERHVIKSVMPIRAGTRHLNREKILEIVGGAAV